MWWLEEGREKKASLMPSMDLMWARSFIEMRKTERRTGFQGGRPRVEFYTPLR